MAEKMKIRDKSDPIKPRTSISPSLLDRVRESRARINDDRSRRTVKDPIVPAVALISDTRPPSRVEVLIEEEPFPFNRDNLAPQIRLDILAGAGVEFSTDPH